MRVLIVRLSSFGDVVHTFPALSDLAAARPDIQIDWLVDKSFSAFAALHPAVGEVIAYPERNLRWPPSRWPARLRARRALRRELGERGYDLVVDLQGLLKSARVARLAAAPVAGYDADSIRESMASRFYNRRFAVAKELHAVERNRRLLAAALGYEVPAAPGVFGLSRESLRPMVGLPAGFCILVHSASWPSKLWPENSWRRLIGHLAARNIPVVLPWGSDDEKARAERIAAGNRLSHVLPSRLDGADLAAIVGRARLSIGLDSGLMHLATALDVPGVWLFGPTDPGLTGPYGSNQIIVQSTSPEAPCRTRDCAHGAAGARCMEKLDYDRVASAVEALVGQTSA